jgi:excisionase family DNA binding protein
MLIVVSMSLNVKGLTMNTTQEKRAYFVEEAAFYIGGSRPTVYRLMDSGALPSIHIGRRRMILKEDLDQFLQDRKAQAGS